MITSFKSVDVVLSCGADYSDVCKVVLTFKFVDEILKVRPLQFLPVSTAVMLNEVVN